jgi:urease accessory protein
MTDSTSALAIADTSSEMSAGWKASLTLYFEKRLNRTVLAKRAHKGPLVIQKILYPEGDLTPHGVIIHPPGGVAGGDQLSIDLSLKNGAQALLTTPGATKWYKSAGRQAQQHINIHLEDDSQLEWLPQENIVFEDGNVELNTSVNLSDKAIFSTWDIVCLGRKASGEAWQTGRFKQRVAIKRNGRLIWNELALMTPDSLVMKSVAGLRGNVIFGGFVVAAGAVPEEIVDACRLISVSSSARIGVSALPDVFTARYIGQCTQEARTYFEALRQCLRPWYASKEAVAPRIWAT